MLCALQRLLRDTSYLFEDHKRDAADSIMTAYNSGTYTMVLEFIAFTERLVSSHTRALVRTQRALGDVSRAAAATNSLQQAAPALAAACSMLPVGECPAAWRGSGDGSAGATPASSTGSSKQGRPIRFNQDLATRPPWHPPPSSSCSLAVTEWWQGRAGGDDGSCGTGSDTSGASSASVGRCWWGWPGSAEGASPAAQAWRSSSHAIIARQWLLPHTVNAAVSIDAAALAQLLPQLLSTYNVAPDDDATSWLQRQVAEAGGCFMQLAELLPAALFAVAAPLAEALSSQTVSSAEVVSFRASAIGSRCQLLSDTLTPAAAAIVEGLSDSGLPCVSGGTLNDAMVFSTQLGCWVSLCLQAWSRELKGSRKRRAKGQGSTGSSDAEAAAISGLKCVHSALVSACQQVADALDKYSSTAQDGRVAEMLSLAASEGAELLWSGPASLGAPSAVLQKVVEEQAGGLAHIRKALSGTLKHLAALEF